MHRLGSPSSTAYKDRDGRLPPSGWPPPLGATGQDARSRSMSWRGIQGPGRSHSSTTTLAPETSGGERPTQPSVTVVGQKNKHWDDLCRIGGSLKLGHVSASLLTGRLQAGARQHPLAKALLEHGKLLRTVHAVRWFAEEVFRRRIGRQLNRGESVNDLRRHLWVAQRGNVHHRHHDDQTMQAHCHTLLTNACILWTTLYLQDAVDAHRADGIAVPGSAAGAGRHRPGGPGRGRPGAAAAGVGGPPTLDGAGGRAGAGVPAGRVVGE